MLSPSALAMTQCPAEFEPKSMAFWAVGWAVFAAFVAAGAVLSLLMFRITRFAARGPRWALRIASIPAMLAMWLLGAGIFLGQFVLAC
ncbi:MAG: hypothetical protein ACN6O2_03585 [Stenotrophomonas sp.]